MASGDLWVFGYGSLIWNPGFDHVETMLATMGDHARSFCMRSIHHRGTVELISSAYLEEVHEVALADGRRVEAVTYVIDRDHVQYCGGLPLGEQAGIIARAVGDRGPNRDYLFNTADHLAALGIEDPELSWLARVVRSMEG